MKKPQNWENVSAEEFDNSSIPAGGYICKILKAEEGKSQKGDEMMLISLEIDEGEYRGHFLKKYNTKKQASNGEPVKYPCIYRQLFHNDTSIKYAKQLINAVEKSNDGYKWDWNNPQNVKTLTGKLVGFIFGENEFLGSNGKVYTTCQPKFARSVETIRTGDFKIPEKQCLPASKKGLSETEQGNLLDTDSNINSTEDLLL